MYEEKVNEKLTNTDVLENNIVYKWNKFKEVLDTVAEEVLGQQRRQIRAAWFDEECEIVTTAKKESYRKVLQKRHPRAATEEYREKRRAEKRTHRRKKWDWENKKLEDIEQHRNLNEVRKFYRNINEGRKPYKPIVTACKDENGGLLTEKTDVLDRWKRHFEELLTEETRNGSVNADSVRVHNTEDDLEPPDDEEIEIDVI